MTTRTARKETKVDVFKTDLPITSPSRSISKKSMCLMMNVQNSSLITFNRFPFCDSFHVAEMICILILIQFSSVQFSV